MRTLTSLAEFHNRQELRFTVVGCLVGFLLLVVSFLFTGSPFMVVGVAIAVPLLAWVCVKPKRLIYLLMVYCCLYPFLTSDFGMPRLLSYGGDLINVLAALFALRSGKLRQVRWGSALIPFLAFCLVALLTAVFHGISPLLFVWEARNVLRFFVFLVACAGLIDADDIHKIIRFLLVAFVINLATCTFESLVLHFGQDNTNGIFGSGSGGNAATLILLLEMTCFALFGYGRKVVGLPTLLLVVAGSCWISIIAELKFYFVLLACIAVFYVLVSKPSFKTVFLVVLLIFALWGAIQLFYVLVPGWDSYFDLGQMIESSSEGGYGSAEGLNRLSAVSTLQTMFLGEPLEAMFGLGFGAGTYSQFFASPLYEVWGEILHWTWFTDAQLFLETGYVGLVCYGVIFVCMGVYALRVRKVGSALDQAAVEVGAVLSFFSVLLMVYNCVLTVDPGGYMIFFFLAIPYVVDREARAAELEGEV